VRSAFGREALVVGPGIAPAWTILIENTREVARTRNPDAVAGFDRAKAASWSSTSARRRTSMS